MTSKKESNTLGNLGRFREKQDMRRDIEITFTMLLFAMLLASCTGQDERDVSSPNDGVRHYRLGSTTEILVTSEAGDRIANKENVSFTKGVAVGTVITIEPEQVKQSLLGIGSSFTESSAFVLAHLDEDQRQEVMDRIYGERGANFSMARTTIGSTDFSVTGKFSYAAVDGDSDLQHFSIEVDRDGFSRAEYPGIRDESYDLLPMIHEALAIKRSQPDPSLGIVASAWTAPPWMKDIEDWYIGGTPETFGEGTGGRLKEQYVGVYADYLVKYLDAYRAEGVEIWGLTPVNEPHGNSGQWESMHFTPETQRDFIKSELGPKLRSSAHRDVRLLIYDQNRDDMEHWADVILGDPEAAQYVYGTAVHWYASTYKVFEEAIAAVRERFPGFEVIHTEGTIDNLGLAAPGGIADPERFQESGWFDNDAFWWNENATDWAYTASWAPNAEDHPAYTPVHRYARNIIVSLNHGMAGWIDWNVVLDRHGGPNHVGNLCGAPIMIDTDTSQVYYTPVYYVLAQLSRTIRPGDRAVHTDRRLGGLGEDDLHASAAVNNDGLLSVQLLNTTKKPITYGLQIGAQFAEVEIPANSIQTVRVLLN
jgi:glucosylceramidase